MSFLIKNFEDEYWHWGVQLDGATVAQQFETLEFKLLSAKTKNINIKIEKKDKKKRNAHESLA